LVRTTQRIVKLFENEPFHVTDGHAIQWLLETSTDPDSLLAATKMVCFVEWPANLEIDSTLDLLREKAVPHPHFIINREPGEQ